MFLFLLNKIFNKNMNILLHNIILTVAYFFVYNRAQLSHLLAPLFSEDPSRIVYICTSVHTGHGADSDLEA